MVIGFLLPLLRRLSSRAQALVGAAVMLLGLALTAAWAGLGAGHGSALLIRFGILLVLVGAVLCVRALRLTRRKHGGHQWIEKDDLAAVGDRSDRTGAAGPSVSPSSERTPVPGAEPVPPGR